MRKRTLLCLTSLNLMAISTHVFADDTVGNKYGKFPRKVNATAGECCFPCKGYGASINVDFLDWKTGANDIYYTSYDGPRDPTRHLHNKGIDFDYSAGFRLGLDYLFANEGWKISAEWTRLFNHATSIERDLPLGDTFILVMTNQYCYTSPIADPNLGPQEKGRWGTKFNQFDVNFSKEFSVSKYYIMNPTVGLRGVLLKNGYSIYHTNDQQPKYNTIRETNYYRALGVKAGLSNELKFTNNFSLMANGAASLLYGPKTLSYVGKGSTLSEVNGDNFYGFRITQQANSLIPVLDAGLYLNWADQFFKQKLGLGFKVGYEYHVFIREFNQIVYPYTIDSVGSSISLAVNLPSNFFMHGVTASFQIAF